jgi:hypothetical protein
MKTDKIVCGIRDLKKGERRGAMDECAAKKQIRFYGIKLVDPILVKSIKPASKKDSALTLPKLDGRIASIFSNLKKKREFQIAAEKKGDKEKSDKYNKEINDLKVQYRAYVKKRNDLEAEIKKAEKRKEREPPKKKTTKK